MENSKKTEFFKFGKLENQEDPDSEDSVSHFEDSVADVHGIESLSERLERDLDKLLSKEASLSARVRRNYNEIENVSEGFTSDLEKPIRKEPFNSTHVFSSASNDDYERRNNNEKSLSRNNGDTKIPSEVTDKEYIYMPITSEEIDDEEDMKKSGKWMIFLKGDLQKLDEYWLALIPLYRTGIFIRLKCSTAMSLDQGVINCYTADSENIADIKNTADAIRKCIDYNTIMYYKTNEATALGLYNKFGSKSISKYMHTVNNCLYEKDKFNRWKLVLL